MLPASPETDLQDQTSSLVTIADDDQQTLNILNETIAYISLLQTLTKPEVSIPEVSENPAISSSEISKKTEI